MIFSSPLFFLGFLPLCLAGFAIAGRFGRQAAIGFLSLASLVFYAQWNPKFLLVLGTSILSNFAVSLLIKRTSARLQTFWLVFGITANLAALVYFKYLFPLLHFFTSNGLVRHDYGSIALPLGISFFTFTQIAYLIDLKQGVAQQEYFVSYVLFVTFFPHLIAGPIIHHKEMMPQFREKRRYALDAKDVSLGITWFTLGLFKKVVLADHVASLSDTLFSNPHHAGLLACWQGALAYSMQLYFDFSGYSDMAVGLARMFSIRFPLNFNSPYKAESIIDFWQRWHMTLTRYIMNYVYSPLQMWISRRRQAQGKPVSRCARATPEGAWHMIALPTVLTMSLVGLWHGAALTCLLYGLIHGLYLTGNHLWRTFLPAEGRLRKSMHGPLAVGITFFCVLLGEVMFRATRVTDAWAIYAGMVGLRGAGALLHGTRASLCLLLTLGMVWSMPNTQELLGQEEQQDSPNWNLLRPLQWQPNLLWFAATFAVFLVSLSSSSAESAFLYFQF